MRRKQKVKNKKRKIKIACRCPFCKDVAGIKKLGFCPCRFTKAVMTITHNNGFVSHRDSYYYGGQLLNKEQLVSKYNLLLRPAGYVLKSKLHELRNNNSFAGKKANSRKDRSDFYNSREWREVRFDVLKEMRSKHSKVFCQLCFAENTQVHVDHIKPRSKHPDLELEKTNLQILCASCNYGKSNRDDTDFR